MAGSDSDYSNNVPGDAVVEGVSSAGTTHAGATDPAGSTYVPPRYTVSPRVARRHGMDQRTAQQKFDNFPAKVRTAVAAVPHLDADQATAQIWVTSNISVAPSDVAFIRHVTK